MSEFLHDVVKKRERGMTAEQMWESTTGHSVGQIAFQRERNLHRDYRSVAPWVWINRTYTVPEQFEVPVYRAIALATGEALRRRDCLIPTLRHQYVLNNVVSSSNSRVTMVGFTCATCHEEVAYTV